MRKLIAIFAVAASIAGCGDHKPEVHKTFTVCLSHDNTALVGIKGELATNLYDYDYGFEGKLKFRPHDASDTSRPAFVVMSDVDVDSTTCQSVIGRII